MRRRPVKPASTEPARPDARALLLIDQRPLQRAAWTEFHAARKLHEKAARDLLRHEETDTLAYERWLHGAFPQLVTTLRDLHAQVLSLSHEIESVQYMAALTGRSLKKLWKERQDYLANPSAYDDENTGAGSPDEDDEPPPRDPRRPLDDDQPPSDTDAFFNDLFGDDDAPFPSLSPRGKPAATADARDIYRRLVQHLHPDRGGEWTPARQRLWHEIQQAWAARDSDWLARLELNWDAANDALTPDSSLDRLRRAIAELHAARRDTERKLRDYRRSPAWRFTLSEKKRPQLHRRLETDLHHDLDTLQRQLAYLQATIAAWTAPRAPSRRRPSRR